MEEFVLLISTLTVLAQAVALVLFFSLVWGVPAFFINREERVPAQEKKLWIIGNVFFPWLAFLAFLLVAPVMGLRRD